MKQEQEQEPQVLQTHRHYFSILIPATKTDIHRGPFVPPAEAIRHTQLRRAHALCHAQPMHAWAKGYID